MYIYIYVASQVSLSDDNNDNLVFLCLHIVVVGFGVDPALRISVFDELTLGEGFDGVTQVQGFHSESRAFHFQGTVTHTLLVLFAYVGDTSVST